MSEIIRSLMTSEELKEIALRLSGRPPCKNKQGKGAYSWLADELGVHPSTISRWIRGRSRVPDYWERKIRQMERDAYAQYHSEQLHVR